MSATWNEKRLGNLLAVQNGYAFNSKAFSVDGKMPLIRIRDLKGGTKTETRYTGDFDERYVVRSGDLLIGMDGEFACYEWKGEPSLLNQRVCRLQEFDERLAPRFLLYGVNRYLKEIEDVTGFTTVKHLSSKTIQNIEFPVPPLAEQERIVAILDEAFEGIATATAHAERNLQNARELFQSVLQSTFTQKGEDWVETTLGEATGGVSTGPFGSLLHKKDYVENGIPLVNPAHITNSGIEPDRRKTVSIETAKRLSSYKMSSGDIVIGRRGEMGRCAVVTNVEDGWLCGTGSFSIKPSSKSDPNYIVSYLRSDVCRERLECIAGGAVMKNLSNTALSNFMIPLPPLAQQKSIVQKLDALACETRRLEAIYQRKLEALAELKQSLLHRAFAGEL